MEREEPGQGAGAAPASATRPGLAAPPATLAQRPMDGVFLSPTEDEFVARIAEELEHFMAQGQHQRVLLFPPLSSRLRYLIHRTVESMDLLSSFSVGEGWRRRTVICHSAVRLPSDTSSDQKPRANPPRSQRPAQPWGRGGRGLWPRHPGDTHGDNSRASVGSGRITRPPRKKPEKALYVPKASRKKANWRERESPGAELGGDVTGGDNCPKNSLGDTHASPQEGDRDGGSPGGGSGKQQEEPEEGNVPGKAEHPPCDENSENTENSENLPSVGNSSDPCEQENLDKDCSHSLASGHNKQPPDEAAEEDSSHVIPGGSESQSQAGEQNPSSRDAAGPECGKSSFPLENHSWTELECQPAPAQSLESSRNTSPPAEQHSGNAEQRQDSSSTESQQSPSAAQEEQKALQILQEGPDGALAAPELLQGDPSAPQGVPERKEIVEEEEEEKDVAEALWRNLDLAAGDREGTRQGGLEEECSAELLAEIVGNLTLKEISIERISLDCSSFGEPQVTEGHLGHVTEIYDFPSSLKTEDLMEIFADFHESGFKIQWVDDTHALGIFSSLSTASRALGRRYGGVRLRPVIHGSRQARLRALQTPKLLHLGKERPQTDAAVARRLVSHALGWRNRQQETSGNEIPQPDPSDQQE